MFTSNLGLQFLALVGLFHFADTGCLLVLQYIKSINAGILIPGGA